MPELPEVETIVRDLRIYVVGRQVKSVEAKVPKLFRGDKEFIIGAKIKDVARRGKIILIRFDNKKTLAIHLKMTGQLIFLDKKFSINNSIPSGDGMVGGHPDKAYKSLPPHKYTHIIITFSDGSYLYFNDLRKFGWMEVVDNKGEKRLTKHLGLEPLAGVELGYLMEKYKTRAKSAIKTVLLDQGIMAGIGNIYADETLFCSKINPLTKTGDLTRKQIEAIAKCVPEILERSIKAGGTSMSDYVQLDGSKGSYHSIAYVYGREGKPCQVCGTPIKRIKIAQRSSHYCPVCQK